MATDSVTGPQLPYTTQTLTTIAAAASPPPQITTTTTASSSPSSATDKGKSKIEEQEEEEEEEEEPTCGICLTEGGKGMISRGLIDSCDHYFCFVCIMEWSKLESKCPLCKRRFSSIRRPPKPGVFLSERVVNVPVRDQVYHYFGNASVGPANMYSDVRCAVCHRGTDENLLLLCDLCDSASHTYCVGLGATVPEGDWFCPDCTLLRAEHTFNDRHAEADDQSGLGSFTKISSTEINVSICDIVRDPCISVVGRSSTSNLTSFVPTEGEIGVGENTNEVGSRRQPSALCRPFKLNTRTLSRCQNVHDRIQALRENWNNFRSGSLRFSSTQVAAADQKPEIVGTSGQPDSVSCLSQPLIAQNGPTGASHDRGSHDISKAWKMMDIAKSIEGRKRTKILPQTSNHPLKKINVSKESAGFTSRLTSSVSHQLGYQDLGCIGPGKHQQDHSIVKENIKCEAQILGKQNQGRVAVEDVQNGEQSTPIDSEFTYSQEVHLSLQNDSSNMDGRKVLEKKLYRDPITVQNKVGGFACLNSSNVTAPVDSNMSCAKPQAHASSSSSEINPLERGLLGKNCVDGKSKAGNDAKSEIQSLVKLNLKILTRDKKLEVDTFKQIARLATHSILAACGLDHLKLGVRSCPPSSICCHANEIRELQRSSLMPNCCRECFYVFVKDVVSTIMFEKRGCTEMK